MAAATTPQLGCTPWAEDIHQLRLPKISVWGIIVIATYISTAAIVDLSLRLGWGFTSKDIVMAAIVLAVAVALKLVGTKIISFFGGGL